MPAKKQLTKNRSFSLMVSIVFLITLFFLSAISMPSFAVEEEDCDALSIGYWQNHEGCPTESIWTTDINDISSGTFQSAFSTITGSEICFLMAPNSCGGGTKFENALCKAKGKVLADLSNLVSGRLQLNALIAGADDGNSAFDNLGLNYYSTIQEAIYVLEGILINSSHTEDQLKDVNYVGERIYAFYEDENPYNPNCIYGPFCGDGILDDGEECDDNNNIDGDGCSAVCILEFCGDSITQPLRLMTASAITALMFAMK